MSGELKAGEAIPSVRSLAKSLQISILTVQKAYATLQDDGFIETTAGKGCFVSAQNQDFYLEEQQNRIEERITEAIEIANKVYQILNKEFIYKTANPLDFWNKYENLFNCKNNLNKKRVEKEVFKHCLGDNTKIIEEFNYTPKITLQDGLSNIIEYQQKLLQV